MRSIAMFQLTTDLISGLETSGPTDPIRYYRQPVVGWLFRERINLGLRLLPQRRFARALEIGYGAGAVLLAIAGGIDELHGIDLDADPAPVTSLLASRGSQVQLVQGSVYELPHETASMDLVVSFSVFEHLHEYRKGLAEVSRVLKPGALFLLGMPAVNRMMEVGFRAIGVKSIEDHHVTTPGSVSKAFSSAGLRVVRTQNLGAPRPPFALYYNWLLEKI
jgi:ubiquinone/menaquinone biosynthesis C-methylase UbiE